MGYRLVVVGATGNVGREMLNILDERQFPVDELAVLASRNSLGTEVSFGDKTLTTKDLDAFDFTGWDIALFAVGSDATKKYAPTAAATGCIAKDLFSSSQLFVENGLSKRDIPPRMYSLDTIRKSQAGTIRFESMSRML